MYEKPVDLTMCLTADNQQPLPIVIPSAHLPSRVVSGRRKVQSLVNDALGQRSRDSEVVYDYDLLVSSFNETGDKLRYDRPTY